MIQLDSIEAILVLIVIGIIWLDGVGIVIIVIVIVLHEARG